MVVLGRTFLPDFFLGDELFALPLLEVREIIGRTDATPVPNMPKYLRGVFNLRGRVVPVIDRASVGHGIGA